MRIPRSSLYLHRHKTKARTADEDKASVIRRIQARCGFTIGRRRMSAQMKRESISMGESQCHRLMQKFGLQARIRQIRKTLPYTRHPLKNGLPDNILNRNFRADIPMHRLLTDVTYVPYYENGEYHWGYLNRYGKFGRFSGVQAMPTAVTAGGRILDRLLRRHPV